MRQISLTSDLRAEGYATREIAGLVRTGEIAHLRRGAYGVPVAGELTVEEHHRRLVMATALQLRPGAVVSHGSAAVLHGLPVWAEDVARVHLTRSRSQGAKRRSVVEVHGATLTADDVTVLDGVPVTTLTRTVLDLARTVAVERSVAAGDRALAVGLTASELQHRLVGLSHWPGVRRARRAVDLLDPLSESAGESVSRVRLLRDGLPRPTLQHEVTDRDGVLVGRADFAWREHRTLGEFDGKVKYGRLLRDQRSVPDVVYAEKVREDALRDLGWQVVRWVWADLYRPGVIRDRLLRAFARAARSAPHTPSAHFTPAAGGVKWDEGV